MNRRPRRGAPALAILMVCTGNICRSPLAEQVMRQALSGDPRYEVASAGLNAVVGAPMDPMAAEQLRAHGGDPHGLMGEQLDDPRVDAADLILTMTRGQRDHLIRMYPRAAQRTFTLAEFAALTHALPSASPGLQAAGYSASMPHALVQIAAQNRFKAQLGSTDDIEDPVNASAEIHARVATQIATLVKTITTALHSEAPDR